MDRKAIILKDIRKEQYGIEIGPSFNPCAPKSQGYNCDTLDHLDEKELIKKYENHNVEIKKIEHVDYIWNGETYSKLIGKKECYDYIIASHVIEHTTDLIQFLKDCEELLKDEGILILAIPDKRFCFDCFRERTPLGKVINDFYCQNKLHTPGTVLEDLLNAVTRSGDISWNHDAIGQIEIVHDPRFSKEVMHKILRENVYWDSHEYVFTPNHFKLLITDLQMLGFINFNFKWIHDTVENEFFVTLEKKAVNAMYNPDERIEMMKAAQEENCFKENVSELLGDECIKKIYKLKHYNIDKKLYSKGYLYVRGWGIVKNEDSSLIEIIVKVPNEKNRYFKSFKMQRSDVANHFNNTKYEYSGFVAYFPCGENWQEDLEFMWLEK